MLDLMMDDEGGEVDLPDAQAHARAASVARSK
jgi:hypothetical protein